MTPVTIAALSVLTALGGPLVQAGAHPTDSVFGPGDTVPFVAQGRLLCGGAAAAMVERYWGARGVYAEDYAHLVRQDEGGIRTSDLASALRERGFDARPHHDDPRFVLERLAAGSPPILLLGPGGKTLHYVVLVALGPERAWVHDPNDGPSRVLPRDELMRRWSASGYWALVAAPSKAPKRPSAEAPVGAGPAAATPPASTAWGEPTNPAVAAGMARLRSGEAAAARSAVRPLLEGPAEASSDERALARRITATAFYLEGDRSAALRNWNSVGEPRVDLVRVDGTHRIRHVVATDGMGIRHGRILTPRALALARRRLAEVPAVRASRVDYAALPDGTVEVRASVLESEPWPTPLDVVLQTGRAATVEEAGATFGPFFGAGDRWRIAGSWEGAYRYALADVRTAGGALPGLVELALEWKEERYGGGVPELGPGAASSPSEGRAVEERIRGGLEVSEWLEPSLGVLVGVGLERWAGGDRMGSLAIGGLWRAAGDRLRVDTRVEGWAGHAPAYARATLDLHVDLPMTDRHRSKTRILLEHATEGSPKMVWPGAGVGRVRPALLRGHPLAPDRVISGPAIGRSLASITLEHRVLQRVGPLRVGAAIFVDAAAVWRPDSATARRWLDPGVSLLAELGGRTAAVSLARGSNEWVLSARVE